MKNQNSKLAFTLAEVLITLSIVGVVSAMTLPTLIKNYQMKTLEVAFKKQYSNIYNTLNYISMEENLYECHYKYTTSYVYTATDCNALRENMIKRMKLKEIKHDFKNYALKSDVINNGGASTNIGFSYDEFVRDSRGKAYLSPDGSVYIFSDSFNRFKMFFVLDTNGKKGPNKWGYDVFLIGLYNKNNNLVPNFRFSLKEKDGFYPTEILQNKK